MSAKNRQGSYEVTCAAYELLKEAPKSNSKHKGLLESVDLNHVAETVSRQRSTSMNEFELSYDNSSNTWHVNGTGLDCFIQITNWQYKESMQRFQHVLEAAGVNKAKVIR